MNREDYRRIKNFSKQEMERWLYIEQNTMYNKLNNKFNEKYKMDLNNSIQNFIVAIGYTLHFNEDVNLNPDELSSFMNDLFITVDMFKTGEYKPDDYTEQLKEDGIIIEKYDNDRVYREYKNKINDNVKQLHQSYINKLSNILEQVKSFQNGNINQETKNELSNLETFIEKELSEWT